MADTLKFAPDGSCRFIYSDELAEIAPGPLTTRRASHVEPAEDGQWMVDMSPVGGPVYGPFTTRKVALEFEVNWLNLHDIPIPR